MDAIRLLGGILESNAIGGQVLGALLQRTDVGDPLAGVIKLFAPGTIASGLSQSDEATAGLLAQLAAGAAPAVAHESQNEAKLFVQALCSAAKADGELSQAARDAIVATVVDVGNDEADFFHRELEALLDVREFAARVPGRLAHQVYAFSMMGLAAKSRQKVQFLSAVAQGLGVDWIVAKKIHAELGGPNMFG